jgi:hypothetical protein
MYCRKCGSQNDDNAYRCVSCGEIIQQTASSTAVAEQIPNYLVQAILVTLFCCLPLGIPAIVFSAQVNGKFQAGDIAGAREASRKAKMFCWWSLGLGLFAMMLYVMLMIFAGIAGA